MIITRTCFVQWPALENQIRNWEVKNWWIVSPSVKHKIPSGEAPSNLLAFLFLFLIFWAGVPFPTVSFPPTNNKRGKSEGRKDSLQQEGEKREQQTTLWGGGGCLWMGPRLTFIFEQKGDGKLRLAPRICKELSIVSRNIAASPRASLSPNSQFKKFCSTIGR